MAQINLIDVTMRDAHQCLWATRMTNAMIAPVLDLADEVGFHTIDLVGGAVFDVCVRYLQENPWARMRMAAQRLKRTPINVWMRGASLFTFEYFPRDVVELTIRHLAANGVRHLTTYDALNDNRNLAGSVRAARAAGIGITGAVVYTLSPVHTDAYFQARARELVALGVDRICLKDPSGLLTPERVRTLAPAVLAAAPGVPLELHSHCLSGLAPQVYCDALAAGVTFFHTAVRPLANGASLPPAEDFNATAGSYGCRTGIDAKRLEEMSAYFEWVARREGKPTGKPLRLDPRMYEHQVPGGMISNLRTQLRAASIEARLDDILAEVARVREDLGYPIMVSPFAQFLITQATLNVVQGERYRTIPDELRKYALGHYGRHAGALAPEFLERATRGERAVEDAPADLVPPALPRLRAQRGARADDDEILLAAYYDDSLVRPVLARSADALSGLRFRTTPLAELVHYLARHADIERVRVAISGVDVPLGGAARKTVPIRAPATTAAPDSEGHMR
jgi:pyruvate/oxaloacetate carboxyltransferase